jgi:hypothetical protein
LVRVIAKLRPLITYKFKEPGFKKTSSEWINWDFKVRRELSFI